MSNRLTISDLEKLSPYARRQVDAQLAAYVAAKPATPPPVAKNSNVKNTKKAHHESDLQKECIRWFRATYPQHALRLWAVPNAARRNVVTASILKSEGMLSGVCDILFTVPRGKWAGMMIEMKYDKGVLSENQKAFIAAHKDDYKCVVCRSLEEFKKEVTEYEKSNT